MLISALKCDLREDVHVKETLARRSSHPVTYDEGLAMARVVRAARYLECSAKHNRGVREALLEAARVAVGTRAKGAKGNIGECHCIIM